jgi:hypothetical protein
MSAINRPYVRINISKWEIFLLMTHVPIVIAGFMYYYTYWHDIPEILISNNNKWREMPKQTYLSSTISYNLCLMIFGCYYILVRPRYKYWKGRDLSQNSSNVIIQYRIETSCLLCNFTIVHILLLLSGILGMEGQINRIYIPDNWAFLFIIPMLFTWLIHHILWTRLSDK